VAARELLIVVESRNRWRPPERRLEKSPEFVQAWTCYKNNEDQMQAIDESAPDLNRFFVAQQGPPRTKFGLWRWKRRKDLEFDYYRAKRETNYVPGQTAME
jgi:hypothetical protein